MSRISYVQFDKLCELIDILIELEEFRHIRKELIHCIKSRGSKSKAIARIYGLPKPWIIALKHNPGYVIEVLEEKFCRLSSEEKIKVVIHELLHIPYTFGGGLRPHGRLVNGRRVYSIFVKLRRKKQLYQKALSIASVLC